MKVIFNSRVTERENIQISTTNRGFCYGDGLFETIVTGSDRINLVHRHLSRLEASCETLQINFPIALKENLKKWIDVLSRENRLNGDIRTKIQVWRDEGGLYAPVGYESSFLVEVKDTNKPIISSAENIGVSETANNKFTTYAAIKSMNALDYVMAGLEMKEKGLDEIILLDTSGHLSETHIGNLFWLEQGQLYTPSLKTGCIAGVMRSFILDNFKVKEVLITPEVLTNAQGIFSCNASGITWFKNFEGQTKAPPKAFLEEIKPLLQP